ncbi:guanitoxin biosynthesis heme-dependent pre-guanitoxin N-hydroxylase GntA [Spirillospora sp. NPDC048911]|uniref:guanitoxin biosynthesis heme-dependent pre-guanitoxin N-hydroxylase GntA n=1 Tax=Spirillospora sp. NPDC048911 TaxID=3364527 RepID=UPI003717E407
MADGVRQALIEKVTGDSFACVAAKTAARRGAIVHRHYGVMGDDATTEALHADLAGFAAGKDDIDLLLASFVATFDGPAELTEEEFDEVLWHQLQRLHDLDSARFGWSGRVDPDPSSRNFGFSAGGHPFFVVGLHPRSSRVTRRFDRPALAFNSHVQFDRLKERGIYPRLQRETRAREMALQGSLNPNLAEFGEASEAFQYSGLAVDSHWKCPFRPHVAEAAAEGSVR